MRTLAAVVGKSREELCDGSISGVRLEPDTVAPCEMLEVPLVALEATLSDAVSFDALGVNSTFLWMGQSIRVSDSAQRS